MKYGYLLLVMLVYTMVMHYTDACKTEDVPKNCDYIVVGAGAAGATIAARLSENPNIIVCLFEAGIRDTDGQFGSLITIPRLWTSLSPGDVTWNTTTVPQKYLNNRTPANGMGKALGGSTSHNGQVYFRGFKADFDYWADNGAPGWDFDSILPFFLKSENMTIEELRDSPLHSTCGPLTISNDKTVFTTPIGKLWKNMADEIGMPIGECNRESPFGLCGMQATIKDGKRASTARAFLHPVMGRRNLIIVTEALVGRILISDKNKRAYGIRYSKHGRIYTVGANKEVIISGGTFESPKLLQLSGIGPKSLLRRLKIRPHMVLPVGQDMQDHAIFLIDLDIKTPKVTLDDLRDPKTVGEYMFQAKGLWATNRFNWNVYLDLVKQKHNWPEIQFHVLDGLFEDNPSNADIKAGVLPGNGYGKKKKSGITLVFFLAHPKSRGTIQARSTDPEDSPLIDPKYYSNPSDIKLLIRGIRKTQTILKQSPSMRKAGAKLRVRGAGYFNQESADRCFVETHPGSDKFWDCVLRQQTSVGLHAVRSCPMGKKGSKWAVVDPELRVYGVRRLRVADASVMPQISSGNTMGPSIMIGERAADFILKDYLSGKY